MKIPHPVTIDFETFKIEGRPAYPPIPVGVSIKYWGKKAKYYAWAHPVGRPKYLGGPYESAWGRETDNNCTKAQAKKALKLAYKTKDGILCQSGKLDIDVAETHMGMPRLPWDKYHDTLYLLFLNNPHAEELSLKPSAEHLLGWAPEEQDAVADWLIKNQPVEGITITRAKKSDYYFGGYIAYAPVKIVGPYANGDTERTEALFKFLYPQIVKRKMLQAYDRDRELMLMLLETERQGIPVAVNRLKRDIKKYEKALLELETWVYKYIKAEINLNAGMQLVKALQKVGKIDVDKLGFTPKSMLKSRDKWIYKSDKESLKNAMTDTTLAGVLRYRSQLNTCLNTFMKPWLRIALQSDGKIFTTWYQTRNTDMKKGARTGRLSSSPNFQNMPNKFDNIKLPKRLALPPLPIMRSYIIPWSKDHVLIDRDYSQQEIRGLGHYEEGVIMGMYLGDPWVDVHEYARIMINQMLGKNFPRKIIKNFVFGLIYGMGVGLLAKMAEITVNEAREVKNAILAIFPGLRSLNRDMKIRAKSNQPIRTWGGREYYCEPSKLIDGKIREFDYKMLNCLIQGSSADCTKQALINFWNVKDEDVKVYLTLHDEILLSVPKKKAHQSMMLLKYWMEAVEFDIPMLSEGEYSNKNWAELKPYDKKGEIVCRVKK